MIFCAYFLILRCNSELGTAHRLVAGLIASFLLTHKQKRLTMTDQFSGVTIGNHRCYSDINIPK